MAARAVPLGRWARLSFAASAPLALAFLVLAVLGLASPLAAVLAWAALSLLACILVGVALSQFEALRRHLDAAARQDTPPRSHAPQGFLIREASSALERLFRLHAERQMRLERSRREIEHALDALPEPLLLLSAERKIVRANRSARALLGENCVGGDIATALRDPGLIEAIRKAAGGEQGRTTEFTLQTPVERVFATRIERLPQTGDDGARLSLTLMEVTEMRRTERMRADFVANASHEIRTPLATLAGFIETLQGPARDDAEARERFLAIMEQHTRRMTRLVDDLLSLSRIEMTEHTAPTDPVPLAPLLAHIRNTLSWQAERREVPVALDIEKDIPPAIGDGDELTQVFVNLLDNAIKYGAGDEGVTLRARWVRSAPATCGWNVGNEGALAISVIDRGAGIPGEHLARLTERFYRIDKARSREFGGTGLGLAIVKHIASRHCGALEIESKVGEGSTFTVYLRPAPMHESDPPAGEGAEKG